MLLVGTFNIKAQNVYTFTKKGMAKTFSIQDVRSLTFSKGNMNINLKNGKISSIPFVDLTKLTFKISSGIKKELKLTSLIQIYPNPVEKYLYIDCKNVKIDTDFDIQVISMNGKIIYHNKMKKASDISTVNVSQWKKGVYFVHIQSGKQHYTKKFIKK